LGSHQNESSSEKSELCKARDRLADDEVIEDADIQKSEASDNATGQRLIRC
jgi:hypothetical protein